MRSCAPDVKIFRIQLVVPGIGVVGLLFWLYVILYATEVINWVLFSMVDDFRLRITDGGTIVFLLLMVAMCVVAVFSSRIRVTLDTDGVVYRGCFRTVRLLWRDVTRMTYSPRGVDICLWAGQDYVRFGQFLSRGRELLVEVKERVSTNASSAQIVQSQPRFLPRLRKPERGTDAKVGTGKPR